MSHRFVRPLVIDEESLVRFQYSGAESVVTNTPFRVIPVTAEMDGTSEAARELFEAHGAAVYRFAAVLVRHHQDAEDVVQETFLSSSATSVGRRADQRARLDLHRGGARGEIGSGAARWIPWLPAHDARVPPPVLPDEDGRLKAARDALRRLPQRDRLLLVLRAQGLSCSRSPAPPAFVRRRSDNCGRAR